MTTLDIGLLFFGGGTTRWRQKALSILSLYCIITDMNIILLEAVEDITACMVLV